MRRSEGSPGNHSLKPLPEEGCSTMATICVNRRQSGLSKALARSGRSSARGSTARLRGVEVLEGRELLTTFSVTNLHGAGGGSLRQAIIASNNQPGANTIDFAVAGTIRIGKTSLPAI